jgi:hypothetical protein
MQRSEEPDILDSRPNGKYPAYLRQHCLNINFCCPNHMRITSGRFRSGLLALGAAVSFVIVAYLTFHEPARRHLLTTAGTDCIIDIEPVTELHGDQVAAGLVRLTPTRILLERVSEIAVFDRQGRFRRTLGRAGSGPGEFRRIQQVVPLSGERIAVFQANPPQLAIVDSGGAALKTATLPVSISRNGALILSDSSFVLAGAMHSDRENYGRPMVRITQDGEVISYFGQNEVETEDPLLGRMMPREIAWHPRRGVVAVKRFKYAVEVWDERGTLQNRYARKAEWLNWPPVVEGNDPHRLGPPEDQFRGAQFDDQSRLWLLAQVTPPDWQSGIVDGRVIDPEKWTDTHIEVLDLASKKVLCSARFQPFVLTGFVGPLQIASFRENSIGDPTITIWQLSLRMGGGRNVTN